MGLFDSGRKLLAVTGFDETCDYLRDGFKVGQNCPCKIGQTSFALADYGNATTRVFRIDFIISADAISIGRPDVRDVIEWKDKRYAVIAPAGEPCWRWHDRAQTVYRIHVEEVDNESVN